MPEFEKSWAIANTNPYADPDFDIVNQPAQILNGGLRGALNYGGPTHAVYNGALNRNNSIVAWVTLGAGGVLWNDPRGPGLIVREGANAGKGYWLRINGDEAAIRRLDSLNGSSYTSLISVSGIVTSAGSVAGLSITPEGVLVAAIDGFVIATVSSTTYLSEVCPAGTQQWGNTNATFLTAFACDGLASQVVAPSWSAVPSPPVATIGVPYTYDFSSLISGDAPITASNVGATLPDGLAVVGKTIAGTPTTLALTSGLELRATNAGGARNSGAFSFLVDPAPSTGTPTITGVNSDDTIQSKVAGYVTGTNLDVVTALTTFGVSLTVTAATSTRLDFAAVDIHTLPGRPGSQGGVTAYSSQGSPTYSIDLRSETGYSYMIPTSLLLDPPGLLATTAAVLGDGYEGVTSLAGSVVVYELDGPHRDINPAVPNATKSLGWWFSESAGAWTQIDETTNQTTKTAMLTSANHSPPTHNSAQVSCVSDLSYGSMYVALTLTPDQPTAEAVKVNARIRTPVTATGVQGPFTLDDLDPDTRYYYWFVQDSTDEGLFSNVTGGSFLTTASPVGPPEAAILSNPFHAVAGPSFGSVGVTSNSDFGTLYFVASLSPVEPPPEDIHHGIGVESHGSAPAGKGVNGPYVLTGLDPTQLYYYWFVQDVNT